MERDGRSRVYSHFDELDQDGIWRVNYSALKEVYPDPKPEEQALRGTEAQAVSQRADFRASSVLSFDTKPKGAGIEKYREKYFFVSPKPHFAHLGHNFDVDLMNVPEEEQYQKLVEELERMTGQQGLTIIS